MLRYLYYSIPRQYIYIFKNAEGILIIYLKCIRQVTYTKSKAES